MTAAANRLVWALQILLALAFLAHGVLMLFPPAEVAQQMNATLPRWFQLFIGIAEILAAIGITLPGITGIQPWLVSWAAGGLMIVMVSATIFHLWRRGSARRRPPSCFLPWRRSSPAPGASRRPRA